MAQRLVRAKRNQRRQDPVPRAGDAELPERLSGVLAVLYLVFNEGYAARGRRAAAPTCATRPSAWPACWSS